jgi:hypothetical protein
VTTLAHRRNTTAQLNDLIETSPREGACLSDDHRRSLAARFRAVGAIGHRRIDAWTVERAAQRSTPFRWSPATTRRAIGNAALRRMSNRPGLTIWDAVGDEITDQQLRVAAGYARGGSLGCWLASASPAAIALVSCEAQNWAIQAFEATRGLEHPWRVAVSDAYYDVATARTTLRGRRDLVVGGDDARIIIRFRAGAPGRSAGPGLRADLTIDALAHREGVAPSRIIGLWPEAGVSLCVDGTMADLRAGARDLVRTAVVQHRQGALDAAPELTRGAA